MPVAKKLLFKNKMDALFAQHYFPVHQQSKMLNFARKKIILYDSTSKQKKHLCCCFTHSQFIVTAMAHVPVCVKDANKTASRHMGFLSKRNNKLW